MKRVGILLLFLVGVFSVKAWAKDLTILYTGDTHSMIYPCHCPIETDGGIARRATLVKEIRSKSRNVILVDSGGMLAGGPKDQYSQNTELDKKRAFVNLGAAKLMGYDAVNVNEDAFNFGSDFLASQISGTKIPFISSNVKSDKILPFVIKNVDGIKIAILGLTSALVKNAAPESQYADPADALSKTVAQVKAQGANIIVLLSYFNLGEEEELIRAVPGIDILISNYKEGKKLPQDKIGSTIVVGPSWQGRRMGKLDLKIDNGRIVDYKNEQIRLSDKLIDDPGVLKILPHCFSDYDCQRKQGVIATCQNPSMPDAQCILKQAKKIPVIVIRPKKCLTCDTDTTISNLRSVFTGLDASFLDAESDEAKKIIKDLDLTMLPAYLFNKDLDSEKEFNLVKDKFYLKNGYYIVKPSYSGVSYFIGRQKVKGELDVLLSLFDNGSKETIAAIAPLKPNLHVLAVKNGDSFGVPHGQPELEEDLRVACIMKYYPDKLWDYMSCRVNDISSSWWDDCIRGVDLIKVKECARSSEGAALLEKDVSLNKELQIMFGPTYLLNNQEIFSTRKAPTTEEIKKLLEAQ